ncbi:glycosyltransferase family 2 protein [Yeosuana sp. AK3]
MKRAPLVSIITVVFNGEKYIQQTIDSVYNQTYKNIEYIIIDGVSTDSTINIIKNNQDKISRWISEPDKGIYDAMNKGVKMAKGELIGIINSDDWYNLDTIQIVVDKYLNHPTKKIFHGNRFDIFENLGKKEFQFNKSVFKFKYFCMTYSHPAMFISKELYKTNNYNTNLKLYSDYQFVLTEFLKNPIQFCYINKPLVNFRLGGESSKGSFLGELKESFHARRNARMSIIESVFAYVLVLILRPMINLVKALRLKNK